MPEMYAKWNPIAESRTTSTSTTRLAGPQTAFVPAIRDEVGELLQHDLPLEDSRMPSYLNRLIDELRKWDK